jgi:hypothetical protein
MTGKTFNHARTIQTPPPLGEVASLRRAGGGDADNQKNPHPALRATLSQRETCQKTPPPLGKAASLRRADGGKAQGGAR